MKKIRKILLLPLLLAIVCVSLFACTPKPTPKMQNFDEFCDDLLHSFLANDAMSVNFLFSDPKKFSLENASISLPRATLDKDDYVKAHEEFSKMIDKIKAYPDERLTKESLATKYILLENFKHLYNKKNSFFFQNSLLDPNSGVNTNLPMELLQYKILTQKDIDNYFSIISDTNNAFDNYVAYEKMKIQNGYARNANSYQNIVKQTEKIVQSLKKENFLQISFAKKIDKCNFLTDEQKPKFKQTHQNLIENIFVPAYKKLCANVALFVMSATKVQGMSEYKGGRDEYTELAQKRTSTNDTPQQMIDGLIEYATEIEDKISKLVKDFVKEFPEENLSTLLNKFGKNPDYDLDNLHKVMDTIITKASNDFPSIPETIPPLQFQYVDESVEKFYAPAAYFISYEDKINCQEKIVINKSCKTSNLYEILSHEGYPGHLLQHTYFKTCEHHTVRRLFSHLGYAEGWANYCQIYTSKYYSNERKESLCYELYVLGSALQGLRLSICDIMVNYNGYKTSDIAKFFKSMFVNNSDELDNFARGVFEFVVENPANYLSYYYGLKKMNDIKKLYKKKLGDDYTDKKFHTAVLEVGPMNFQLLKKILEI